MWGDGLWTDSDQIFDPELLIGRFNSSRISVLVAIPRRSLRLNQRVTWSTFFGTSWNPWINSSAPLMWGDGLWTDSDPNIDPELLIGRFNSSRISVLVAIQMITKTQSKSYLKYFLGTSWNPWINSSAPLMWGDGLWTDSDQIFDPELLIGRFNSSRISVLVAIQMITKTQSKSYLKYFLGTSWNPWITHQRH